jgi:hypothetical protein
MHDFLLLQKACGESGMSDVVADNDFFEGDEGDSASFSSDYTMDKLLFIFRSIDDCHVAVQTLQPIEQYTGERDYDREIVN